MPPNSGALNDLPLNSFAIHRLPLNSRINSFLATFASFFAVPPEYFFLVASGSSSASRSAVAMPPADSLHAAPALNPAAASLGHAECLLELFLAQNATTPVVFFKLDGALFFFGKLVPPPFTCVRLVGQHLKA